MINVGVWHVAVRMKCVVNKGSQCWVWVLMTMLRNDSVE